MDFIQTLSSKDSSALKTKESATLKDSIKSVETIDSISQWIGEYKYFESWKELNGITSASMDYTLKVSKKDDNSLVGNLSVNGFQTSTRKTCKITYTKDKLSIYSENRLQFTFERNTVGKLITNWNDLRPAMNTNHKDGKVRFKKVK